MALYGTDFKDALRTAAVNTVADTVAQELSEKIGLEYGKDDSALNYATHKLAHGAVGAGVGALRGTLDKDSEGGAIAGAMGAVIGEVITESQKEKIEGRVLDRVKELESQGVDITPELIRDLTHQEAAFTMKTASFSSAVAAFSAGKDPNIASNASSDAIENNSLMGMENHIFEKALYNAEEALEKLQDQKKHESLTAEQQQELEQKIRHQEKVVQNSKILLGAQRKGQQESVELVEEIADKISDAAGIATGGTTTVAKQAIKKGVKTVVTKKGQAPGLSFTNNDGSKKIVRFDGFDGKVLIDRKRSVFTSKKTENQALRQSRALKENGLKGRWEVPSNSEAKRARKLLDKLDIKNIDIKVVSE